MLKEHGDLAGTFVSFGGQGGRYFDELARARQESRSVDAMLCHATEVLMDSCTQDDIRGTGLLSSPLDIINWFEPQARPSDDFLSCVLVSHPLILLTQATHILRAREQNSQGNVIHPILGTTGHSQGVLAACLLAMELEGHSFFEAAASMAHWMLRQAFRIQEAFPAQPLSHFQKAHWERFQEGRPSPMASICGLRASELEEEIADFNRHLPETQAIYLALKNTQDKLVLAGPADSLTWFRAGMRGKYFRWRFLRVSAPLHTPYMESAIQKLVADIQESGTGIKGHKLSIPVLRTHLGENLADSHNPTEDLIRDMLARPVDWPQVCCEIERLGPSVLLDMGPDFQSSKLSRENLQGSRIRALSVNIPEENKSYFHSGTARPGIQALVAAR